MKKWIALLLAALLLFALAACDGTADPAAEPTTEPVVETGEEPAAESDIAYVQQKGTLLVGITEFKPMDYKNDDGEWIGFDADMAQSFGDSLGVAVEFVEIRWEEKADALENKTVDCVWNGMTMTDAVQSSMECSKAYCNNAQVVVVRKSEAEQYQTVDACRNLTLAVESGSAAENVAEGLGFSTKPVKSQMAALREVSAKKADAAAIDLLMAAALTGEGADFADLTYTTELNSEAYCVGFRKGSDLAHQLDIFFATAYSDGFMTNVAERYGIQTAIIPQNAEG